jgi:hypothetical protein
MLLDFITLSGSLPFFITLHLKEEAFLTLSITLGHGSITDG